MQHLRLALSLHRSTLLIHHNRKLTSFRSVACNARQTTKNKTSEPSSEKLSSKGKLEKENGGETSAAAAAAVSGDDTLNAAATAASDASAAAAQAISAAAKAIRAANQASTAAAAATAAVKASIAAQQQQPPPPPPPKAAPAPQNFSQATCGNLLKQEFLKSAQNIVFGLEAEHRTPAPTSAQLQLLQSSLCYTFQEESLLRLALYHKSCATPHLADLAWIGDVALQLLVTEQIIIGGGLSLSSGGGLTNLRKDNVCRAHCAENAKLLGLDKLIVVGKSIVVETVMRGGGGGGVRRRRRMRKVEVESDKVNDRLAMRSIGVPVSILGEAFEAVLGAMYVDGGRFGSFDF